MNMKQAMREWENLNSPEDMAQVAAHDRAAVELQLMMTMSAMVIELTKAVIVAADGPQELMGKLVDYIRVNKTNWSIVRQTKHDLCILEGLDQETFDIIKWVMEKANELEWPEEELEIVDSGELDVLEDDDLEWMN